MSDYCPPETLMHINELSEDCLRIIFALMPLMQQLNVGQVCKLWSKVQSDLCLTKKSLIVGLYKYNLISWKFTQYLIDHDLSEDSALTISVELNTERIASLKKIFSNISEITVLSDGVNTLEAQLAMLLTQFRNQLVTFNLKAVGLPESNRDSAVARFIDAINAMAQLKHLSLCFDTTAKFDPFDMPLLTQLESLKFKCPSMPISILELWVPRLESRSEPLQIVSFVCGTFTEHRNMLEACPHPCDVKPFLSLPAKVAAMFTKLPKINCTLLQLQQLSALFTNVTHLKLDDNNKASYSASIPALLQALFAFKKLTNLSIRTGIPDDNQVVTLNSIASNVPCHQLPQLSSVQNWSLKIYIASTEYEDEDEDDFLDDEDDVMLPTYSHGHLNRWMENLGWIFPNLERLSVCLDRFGGCDDCDFDAHIEEYLIGDDWIYNRTYSHKIAKAKKCLRQQLRLIKQQQLPKLNNARIYWSQMYVGHDGLTLEASCTLKPSVKEIAD